jgi:ubiquinone/menaquinone biosynthesis C-methylase UbiE
MRALTRFEQRIVPRQIEHAGRILPYLTPHVSERMRVLDFGNGVGAVAHCLSERSQAHVVGVDVAQNSLFPIPAVAYDGARLPFRDGTFDLVYAVFVLHHCPDVDAVLGEMSRVAKGSILLIEDVWRNWRERLWTYFFHVLFDIFMLLLTLLGRAEWSSFFRYRFLVEEEWRSCFDRLGLSLTLAEDVVLHPRYPVKHRRYLLEKK